MNDYSEFFGDDDSPKLGDNVMKQAQSLAAQQEEIEVEIERLEEHLKALKERRRRVSQIAIPDLFREIGVEELTTEDGMKIQVGKKLEGSISKDREVAATSWLDENGHGAIVKRQFVIDFAKSEEAWAKKFQRDLAQRKRPVNCVLRNTVHHSTLKSWAKEEMGKGTELPMDLLGLTEVNFTKITRKDKS